MITYRIGNCTTHVEVKKFKDGCVNININVGSADVSYEPVEVQVDVSFGNPELSVNDTLFALDQAVHAIRGQYPLAHFLLYMPYLPYARQDRISVQGEGHGLKRLGKFINQMGFKAVQVLDPHSMVVGAALDCVYAVDQFELFKDIKPSWGNTFIVAPDHGALKKCETFAKKAGANGIITCTKHRDPATMELTDVRILDEIPYMSELLILDDLIDGGRTYINLAQALKATGNVAKLELAATHGLFTYGTECVAEHFDMVYTTNSYESNKVNDKVKVIDIW